MEFTPEMMNILIKTSPIIFIISIIGLIVFFIALIVFLIRKKQIKAWVCILPVIFVMGIYHFYTLLVFKEVLFAKDADAIEKAIKLPFNLYKHEYILEMGRFYGGEHECYKKHDDIPNIDKAIEYYEKAIRGKYEKYPFSSYELAGMYLVKEDYAKTIEIIDAMEKKPGSFNCHYFKADALIIQGKHQEALDYLNKFDDEKLIPYKAMLYRTLGQYQKSQSLLANYHPNIHPSAIKTVLKKFDDINSYKYSIKATRKEKMKTIGIYGIFF